jgi:stage III sporulation protein AH
MEDNMINKQNLWFLTLFSFILILGVYYVTLPNDLLEKAGNKVSEKIKNNEEKVVSEVSEDNGLTAMRVNLQEERQEQVNVIQEKLTSDSLSNEEKNNYYEQLKYLNEVQGKEENIEKKIKETYQLDCFTKIDNSNVSVVCVSNEHDSTLANNIMRLIQNDYKNRMNITVKFQKK